MSYKLVVFYRDILSGPWVTLLELIPGSSIIMYDSPWASFRAFMGMRMRIFCSGATSQRYRSDIGAMSRHHCSDVAATSTRRRCDMSGMPFSATIQPCRTSSDTGLFGVTPPFNAHLGYLCLVLKTIYIIVRVYVHVL